jgi:N-acetylmuramoyl-L-alanine amidase
MLTRLESVNRIILSVGHGGLVGESYDPGATQGSFTENVEAKQIATLLASKLTKNGLTVVLVPDYGLSKTIAYINAQYDANTDWAFEIHKDSVNKFAKSSMAKRTGVYYHPTSVESKAISNNMAATFKANGANKTSWSRPDTDSNHGKLAWIRQPKMLSHILECGFMQDDLSTASDDFYASIIAKAICTCLDKTYIS